MLMSNKISTMAKRLPLATRAFGAEPALPDAAGLAEWIAEHRGQVADITTYRLGESLLPQKDAGIGTLCAGGMFYADRIRQSIAGIADARATGELHADTEAVIEDAAGIVVQARGAWCALPAPHALGIEDAFFHDPDEWNEAICGVYRTLMRAMRDTGISGHVLVCDDADDAELAALARQKVFFFSPEPDRETLEHLLEYQHQVAAGPGQLKTLFDLADTHAIRKLFLVNPDKKAIGLARSHLDPDQIAGCGYCTDSCGEYWKGIVASSMYER